MPNKVIAAINKLVAMGRRIKTSERFKLPSCGRLRRRPPPGIGLRLVAHLYAGAGLQLELPFRDYRFPGLQAGFDHQIRVHTRSCGYRTDFYCTILFHYVDERTV